VITMLDFRRELLAQISRAAKQGRSHVEINAGELHRIVSRDENRHAMACRAMRELQLPADEVIFSPPSGDGASYTVRYKLPR
jgi:5-methylcytosine-specific restriction protein A